MSAAFEELAFRQTPIGELSLRRRTLLPLGIEVFEIKLGDEFLMSSLFTVSEIALARLGLAELAAIGADAGIEVAVGGLGLGYTARAVLEHQGVCSVLVIEAMAEVIEWHRRGLVPLGAALASDPRCRLLHGDFFALAGSPAGALDPESPGRKFHAVLVDIDHSPKALLHASHGALYGREGLGRLAGHLHPGGVFALWSNDPPDAEFLGELGAVFAASQAHIVTFHNPLQDREAASTVYVARTA